MNRHLWVGAGLLMMASATFADTLIYEGKVSLPLGNGDGEARLLFAFCIDDVCAEPLDAALISPQAQSGAFVYELRGVTPAAVDGATHLRIDLLMGGERTQLARQPLSRALFRRPGCRPAPTEPLVVRAGERDGLAMAIDSLNDVCIAADETVRIELTAGTHVLREPIRMSHPQGARIEIVGAGAGAGGTLLEAASSAFVADRGSELGLLDGVQIHGLASEGSGFSLILAQRGGRIVLGQDVQIGPSEDGVGVGMPTPHGGWRGLHAVDGGQIVADRVTVTQCQANGVGVLAEAGGMIRADGATVTRCDRGFHAEDGGLIVADNGRAAANSQEGFLATNGALLVNRRVGGANGRVNCTSGDDAEGCGGAYRNVNAAGFRCEDGATLIASNTASSQNRIGYKADACVLANNGGEASRCLGDCVQARYGATVNISGTRVMSSGNHGVSAVAGAVVNATDSTIDDSQVNGIYSTSGSFIDASGAQANTMNNRGWGGEATYWGKILAAGLTATDNALGGLRATGGGRIAGGGAEDNGADGTVNFSPAKQELPGTTQP